MAEMPPIQLDTLAGCERELTRCTNGLAWLDHEYLIAVEKRDLAELQYDSLEAQAGSEMGEKGITATELKGRVTAWFEVDKDRNKVRLDLREARSRLDVLSRWYRSLEKRASNAQSAQKKHLESPGQYGGSD